MTQYDRKGILALKVRSSVQLRKLSRAEMLTRMQILRVIEPIATAAYNFRQQEEARTQEKNNPHGRPWHVSFHASQYPGDDPMACPRQSLYRMMDFTDAKSVVGRKVVSAGIIGKAIEMDIVDAFDKDGILISASPTEKIQTGFTLKEVWLTGSVDSVILPPNWNKPLPVEIKSIYKRDMDVMLLGGMGPIQSHVNQIKVQIALVRHAQQNGEKWANLDPCDHGFIYYFSRDDPSITAEFRVDYDEKFFEMGIERLKRWKAHFLEDMLPELKPGKRDSKFGHPNGWRWSYQPCAWCDYKKICQADFRSGQTQLSKSEGVEITRKIRPNYDPTTAQLRVVEHWRGNKIPEYDLVEEGTAESSAESQ